MQHKLTDRQLLALVAGYCGQRVWDEPRGIYGEAHEKAGQPVWYARTNMGGAAQRMVETLRTNGFLSAPNSWERREGKPYADGYNLLTVKGYEALEERLDRLPTIKDYRGDVVYRFKFDPAEVAARKQARATREAEMARLRKEEQEADRAARAATAAANAERRMEKLRKLFRDKGLADNWSDQELLDFADRVASI